MSLSGVPTKSEPPVDRTVRSPAEPVFLGCFADGTTGRQRTGYSHYAQCVIYRGPDEDYQGAGQSTVPGEPDEWAQGAGHQ